jgi:hypothetical protein
MKALGLFVILLTIGFSAVTLEQAGETASQYADRGESVDIKPPAKTYIGADEYWVMEIIYLGKITAMIPISAETGGIVSDSSIVPALKTHYLANYFATDETIAEHLQDTLTWAQRKYDSFNSALSDLSQYETQLGNVTLNTLAPLKSSIASANSQNNALRQQITTSTQPAINAVAKPEDIDFVKTALNAFFSNQNNYFQALDDVSKKANDFLVEVAGNTELQQQNPQLAAAFRTVVAGYGLAEPITTKKDTLKQNQNTITAFFGGLDGKGDDYFIKLQNRVNNTAANVERKAVADKLLSYSNETQYIFTQVDSIPPQYSDELQTLSSLLNQTQQYYMEDEYDLARVNFQEIEQLISTLEAQIGKWPPQCPGEQFWSDTAGECVCPAGTKKEGTKCIAPGFGINWQIVVGLIAIIVVIILFKKFKREKPPEVETEPWVTRW